MTAEQAAELRALIARQRVLALGVVVEESPYVGLLPYALGDPAGGGEGGGGGSDGATGAGTGGGGASGGN